MFFNEKDTFFTENERFARLIRFYARRLNDECAEADLWSFLWELLATAKKPLTDRYIAVCLRNEYIRLSKIESRLPVPTCEEFSLSFVDKLTDWQIDLEAAFKGLTEKESAVLRLHYVGGYSIDELAKLNKKSRVAMNTTKVKALKKIRLNYFGLDN